MVTIKINIYKEKRKMRKAGKMNVEVGSLWSESRRSTKPANEIGWGIGRGAHTPYEVGYGYSLLEIEEGVKKLFGGKAPDRESKDEIYKSLFWTFSRIAPDGLLNKGIIITRLDWNYLSYIVIPIDYTNRLTFEFNLIDYVTEKEVYSIMAPEREIKNGQVVKVKFEGRSVKELLEDDWHIAGIVSMSPYCQIVRGNTSEIGWGEPKLGSIVEID